MTYAKSKTKEVLLVFLVALPISACVDTEPSVVDTVPSICEEHMGSDVTVHADTYPMTRGEMFFCYGDNGFSVITDEKIMVSFPYHSINAVVVTEQDFLIEVPE